MSILKKKKRKITTRRPGEGEQNKKSFKAIRWKKGGQEADEPEARVSDLGRTCLRHGALPFLTWLKSRQSTWKFLETKIQIPGLEIKMRSS